MKELWINLGLREKQTITIGALIVLVFLLYLIIWSPISNHNETLREEITHNAKLLTWMQEADKRIQSTEKILHKNTSATHSAALLSLLQKEVNQSPLKNNLTQMNQAENNAVQMTFQKINFDILITWLTELWKKQGITVTQITATPNGTVGDIDSVIIVKAH